MQVAIASRLPHGFQKQADGPAGDEITAAPLSRWDVEAPMRGVSQLRVRWGAWLPDVELFDSALFGITGNEADLMDPQHRVLLEVWGFSCHLQITYA